IVWAGMRSMCRLLVLGIPGPPGWQCNEDDMALGFVTLQRRHILVPDVVQR
ncbi:MAG: hypothetical protein QOD62_2380, partial [Actinomycetota bacterium]|nr:hypothetical protein [Actinomycetota bacterium]